MGHLVNEHDVDVGWMEIFTDEDTSAKAGVVSAGGTMFQRDLSLTVLEMLCGVCFIMQRAPIISEGWMFFAHQHYVHHPIDDVRRVSDAAA